MSNVPADPDKSPRLTGFCITLFKEHSPLSRLHAAGTVTYAVIVKQHEFRAANGSWQVSFYDCAWFGVEWIIRVQRGDKLGILGPTMICDRRTYCSTFIQTASP